ncbi:MAG: AsmA family protein [Gammaproteobacteria bacterium]|nr:MAG: AsmA family protein [Gammaproteobacteria bacterium]
MGRLLKLLLFAVAGIVGVLVLVVVLVALLFDPNDYRDRIAASVEAETGRSFVIEGDLELRLFPWLRITSGAMELGNAPGFGDEPFARIEAFSASLRLLPLFSREVELGTLRLAGLRLNLAVDAQGNNNWADLAGDAAEPADAARAPADEGAAFDLADLRIGGIELVDARVQWVDAQADQVYLLENMRLELDALAFGEPANLSFGLALQQQRPALAAELSGRGVLTLDLAAGELMLERLQLDLSARGDEIPAGRQQARVQAAAVQAGLETGTFTLDGLRAELLGLVLSASLQGETADALQVAGAFEVAQFSARETLRLLEIDYTPADATALTRVDLRGELALAGEDLRITGLQLRLDDTTLTGALGSVAGRLFFDLDVDRINADRYLPPAEEATEAPGETGDIDAVEIPVELLRELAAEGELRVGEAILGGLTFRNLVLGLNAGDGRLRLHPVRSEFFEGRYQGDIRIDVRGEAPVLSLNERVTGVQLGALSAAMFEVEHLTGLIEGAFELRATGATLGDMRRQLNGDIVFGLTDGAWEGVDVWHQVRSARATLRQEARPEAPTPPRTEFSEVTGTARVTDGVLDNRDFIALLPFMRLDGQGRVDLAAATLDYRLDATLLDRPELARDPAMADLRGRRLPLRIDGALAEPRIRPDFGAMVTDEVRDQVRGRAEELLRDRLGISRPRDPEDDDTAPDEGEARGEDAERSESSEERLRRRIGRILGGNG